MTIHTLLRGACSALVLALLVSCGGGGGGGGEGGAVSGSAGATGVSAGIGFGTHTGGAGVDAGTGTTGGASTGTGGTAGSGTGDGSTTTTASGGGSSSGDGSGVGSGGTGVTTADAVGVASVDGLGSILLDGLRYDTDSAQLAIADATALRLGMTAKVTGPVLSDFSSGVATRVESAADLRGSVSALNLAGGSFVVSGTTVSTDAATVWADAPGLAAIAAGSTVQVWGLPGASGTLRATRVERSSASELIVTGTVLGLNGGAGLFSLAGNTVDFTLALLSGQVDLGALFDGSVVRVRGNRSLLTGLLSATSVRAWNPLPASNGLQVRLAGIVADFAGSSFRLSGNLIDASAASFTGGAAGAVGNGVKVVVDGTLAGGVLRASTVRLGQGTAGPASFLLSGPVGDFVSAASFTVRGQAVDASGAGVSFVNGSAANLAAGVNVVVTGASVSNGVLSASRIAFP